MLPIHRLLTGLLIATSAALAGDSAEIPRATATENRPLKPMAKSVMEFGAVGDGKADDTEALQRAVAESHKTGSILEIPAGTYRITKTLQLEKSQASGLIVQGAGGRPILGSGIPAKSVTTLLWDGEEGGTLLRATGVCGLVIRDLNFDGNKRAGILFEAAHEKGWGNMLNFLENVHFFSAKVGIQMGSKPREHTNSDYAFHFITFRSLECGMLVNNDQGVDFLFNYIFALSVKKVLHFANGGNLLVNNAQMTNCALFLEIGGGGRNAGTFLANNVRIEWDRAGSTHRGQLLRSNPSNQQANVRFIGFTDAQWAWPNNTTESRYYPLMEIGPGTTVVMESSMVSGPLARLRGTAEAGANLLLETTSFSNGRPEDFIEANAQGFFQLVNNFNDKMQPLANTSHWPDLPPHHISPGQGHTGTKMGQTP